MKLQIKIKNKTLKITHLAYTNWYLTESSSNITAIAKIIKPVEDFSLYEISDFIVNQNGFNFCI